MSTSSFRGNISHDVKHLEQIRKSKDIVCWLKVTWNSSMSWIWYWLIFLGDIWFTFMVNLVMEVVQWQQSSLLIPSKFNMLISEDAL